ncbi:VOC family protein [Phenylobacterium sp.]|uniref:VOC family protein n=1 Tax=Phenylobacterium sp. TaxID=1871053 RepID=UPI0025F3E7A7|nr:VOC family protein [Phenylobacterium sp.]MBX3486123.1 VOC family protein [Phenylobacterium sp.]MCW5759677.1 VOC family protein [Phenylobacterium sp.]
MSAGGERDTETERPGLRVELFVADVARSVAFYRDVLGFEVLRAAPGGYTSIGREGAVLGLNAAAQLPESHPARPRPGHPVGLGVELVVVVEDVAALHARASRRAEVSALVAQPWGLTDFRVSDPDGYYVRVTGPSGSR